MPSRVLAALESNDGWLSRRVTTAVIVFAIAAAGLHVWMAETTQGDLDLASGVWLVLARDLSHGVFYRDLIGAAGYGGTRYFPLFFSLLAGLMRAGLSPIAAGATMAVVTAVLLGTGMFRLVGILGAPPFVARLFAVGSLMPYFALQTMFAVRGDVFAVALDIWGLAYAAEHWRDGRVRSRATAGAAIAFTLAFATKVTSLAVPAAVVLALVGSGRWKSAMRLAAAVGAGAAIVVFGTNVLSDGRALTAWRACMFAGETGGGTLAAFAAGRGLQKVIFSNLLMSLVVIDALVVVVLSAAIRRRRGVRTPQRNGTVDAVSFDVAWLVLSVFALVTGATLLVLASPGTTASNQAVEWIEVSLVLLAGATVLCRHARLALSIGAAMFIAYAAGQNVRRAYELEQATSATEARLARARAADVVTSAPGPVLFESPLWPALSGAPAYVIDPFALRVVMASHHEVFEDLVSRIEGRQFARIVLEHDPETRVGDGWYRDISFGWPVVSRILANYQLIGHPTSHTFVYAPRGAGAR